MENRSGAAAEPKAPGEEEIFPGVREVSLRGARGRKLLVGLVRPV